MTFSSQAQSNQRAIPSRFHVTLLILVGLGLSLMSAASISAEPTSAQPVSIMTYNIRYLNTRDGDDVWDRRKTTVFETLATTDIVGLQEVVLKQLDEIKAATPDWTWYGVGRDDGKSAGEFAPIGYRTDRFELVDAGTQWLSPTPDRPGSKGWDAALPRTFTWVLLNDKVKKKECLVINTHFDHVGKKAREESGRLIASFVDEYATSKGASGELPVIVTGDFNALPESAPTIAVQSGSTLKLTDSRGLSQSAPAGPVGTWNGFQAIDATRRIDFVFVSRSVQVLTHETLNPRTSTDRFASDHLPVRVEMNY
jgi:endonuclease/exonuclease/phosphatase family metal-dependent hydrolase